MGAFSRRQTTRSSANGCTGRVLGGARVLAPVSTTQKPIGNIQADNEGTREIERPLAIMGCEISTFVMRHDLGYDLDRDVLELAFPFQFDAPSGFREIYAAEVDDVRGWV